MFSRIGETFQRSLALFKTSWEILQQDREILNFPLVSGLVQIVLSIVFWALVFFLVIIPAGIIEAAAETSSTVTTSDAQTGSLVSGVIIVFGFIYGVIMYLISLYSQTGVTAMVFIRLDGGDPTVKDGLQKANSMLGRIFQFAIINAVISTISNAIRNQRGGGIVGQIIASLLAGLIDAAWAIASFLTIPIMVREDKPVMDSVKASAQMVADTWGRQLAGSATMGIISSLISTVIVLIAIPLVLLAFGLSTVLGFIVLVLAVAVLALEGLVIGTLNSIYRCALYFYANKKEAPGFDMDLLRTAFTPKEAA